MEKNQFITEKYLDERLKEQSKVLVEAIDTVLGQRLKIIEENLKKEISKVLSNKLGVEIRAIS